MDNHINTFTFRRRLSTMLKVDFKRMFTMRLFYIILATCLFMPIIIVVMTTLMDGTVTVDRVTGEETIVEGLDNVWQMIGIFSDAEMSMNMDLATMVNINLVYFIAIILVCLFIAADFRSGYVKNLFTIRAKKSDYVISKTILSFVCGAALIVVFFAGALLGAVMVGLTFDVPDGNTVNAFMCLLTKVFLVALFVPIYILMSLIGKQKSWLSILLSAAVGMLLFAMIPMVTPLDATSADVIVCLIGGILSCLALGAISNLVLKKKDII